MLLKWRILTKHWNVRKKITALQETLEITEVVTRKCHSWYSETFEKISMKTLVEVYFKIKLHHGWYPVVLFTEIPEQLFWRKASERLLLKPSEKTVFCSTEAVARKCEKSCSENPRKFPLKSTKVCIYILITLHHKWFPGNCLKTKNKA